MDNNRDPVNDLAKALANLCIDEMGTLTYELAKVNIDPDFYWNDTEGKQNCVWVSTARLFGLRVSELEEKVGMKAPPKGASIKHIARFIRTIQGWDRDMNGKPAMLIVEVGSFAADFAEHVMTGMMVAYRRPDGTKHCVLKELSKYMDYQFSDTGYDLTNEIKAQGTMVELAWTFIRPVHAGRPSPVSRPITIIDSKTGERWEL
jgi:hypothetical protein